MKQYKFIDLITNIILTVFNLFSWIYFSLRLDIRKVVEKNKELKKNNRTRCFILGNGPSLADVDLGLLKDEDCFTVNWFYKFQNNFKSKYFLAVDTAFYSDKGLEYIESIFNNCPDTTIILKYQAISHFQKYTGMGRFYYIFPKLFQHRKFISADCTKNMTASLNVICQCIQVALYMGYHEIYLLGCDFNQYASLRPGYFYNTNSENRDSYTNMGNDAKWSSMVHFHHYALNSFATGKGVRIVNLTPNSLIDAYQRDKLENIL